MKDKVFFPSAILSRYVKYYWTCIHDTDTLELMYPSGCVEFCIDISNCDTIRHRGNQSIIVPRLEVLGHWNIPTKASVQKGNICLITRFHPYAGALFFPNQASDFTNQSIDLHDILNRESREFYQRLMEQPLLEQKVKVLEAFLIDKLLRNRKSQDKIALVEGLCNSISSNAESFDIQRLAAESGFSERYIQKLFLNYVGIPPKSFFSVQRFNKSLDLVRSANMSLTNIAYECGYYDQAHFIREFRSYTGIAPSQLSANIVSD